MNSEISVSQLQLTTEQYKVVEQLAGCNYSPEQIAVYLDIDVKTFLESWNKHDSVIRYHYDRGILLIQADADMVMADNARTGNITSYQQYIKQANLLKIDNLKKKLLLDQELQTVDKLRELIEKGKEKGISDEDLIYYEQMDMVRCLYNKYNSKSFIVNALLISYKWMNRRRATEIFSNALNFFYLDNDVKVEAWANIYAEKYEVAANICFAMNDFENYDKYLDKAAKYRGVGKDKPMTLPEGFYDRRPILYSIDPTQFKIKRIDRRKVAEYIASLPDLTEEDIARCNRDLMIEDAEYEIIDTPNDKE